MERIDIRHTVFRLQNNVAWTTIRETLANVSIREMVEEITLRTGVDAYPLLDLLFEAGAEIDDNLPRLKEREVAVGSIWWRNGVRYRVTEMIYSQRHGVAARANLQAMDHRDLSGAPVKGRTRVLIRNIPLSFKSMGDGKAFEWRWNYGGHWQIATITGEGKTVKDQLGLEYQLNEFLREGRITRPIQKGKNDVEAT